MSVLRRHSKPLIAIAAAIVLALTIAACAFLKPHSLALSQPGSIGPVRVHLALCTNPGEEKCEPNEETEEVQYLLGIAVPPGSAPPATITATPLNGGTPIVFSRSDEVATEMAAASVALHKLAEEEGEEVAGTEVWPPAGLQGIGYLSAPHRELEGLAQEWSVDADFGLPAPADGTPFSGPFGTGVAFGLREVSEERPASRPVRCAQPGGEGDALCTGTLEKAEIGTSDLKVVAPQPVSAFVGGTGSLSFGLDFAGTASSPPTFALSGKTTLPNGVVNVASGATYTPGALAPDTHRAPAATSTVTVSVPKTTKPGTYEVDLLATAPGGGTVSQAAQLKVVKPTLKLGKVKLDEKKGTATFTAKVPGAGSLTLGGKGIVSVKRKTKGAKTLKLTIKAKGKAKAQLAQTGAVKVKAKVTFKPTSGISVTKKKGLSLKQSG